MNVVSIVAKIVAGIVVIGFALDKTLFPIVCVTGNSMNPTYKDKEFFLARKVFNHQKLEVGDVVVLQNPSAIGHNILLKRIDGFNYKDGKKVEAFVVGDNFDDSYDSREFGFFPIERILFVAIKSRKKEVSNV